jgi:DNA-sulfur modification-associated
MEALPLDPTPSIATTAADLRRSVRANKMYSLFVFSGTNLGRFTLTSRMSIAEFYEMSAVGNRDTVAKEEHQGEFVAQRKLIPGHAKGLAIYVLRGLVVSAILARRQELQANEVEVIRIRDDLAGGPYAALQPIVCNVRALKFGGDDLPMDFAADKSLPFFKIGLTSSQKLWVVDGQHRREAFGMVMKFLEDVTKSGAYPSAKNALYCPESVGQDGKLNGIEVQFWREVHDMALQECSVTVEIHLGLALKEEGQLFADLNSRGKPLSASLMAQFDKSDAIAAMIGEKLVDGDNPIIRFPIHDETDAKSWDDAGMTLKDVMTINRLLVHGSNSPKQTPPSVVNAKLPFVERFWTVIQSISGFGTERQRSKSVAGQPVVLKALAKLAYDQAYGVPRLHDEEGLKTLYDAILSRKLSFSHDEPVWSAIFLGDEEREAMFPGINDYVYLGDQFKGGEFDATNLWVRFGPAHNDIYPRLGDIVRYKLKLKNRGAAEKARNKAGIATLASTLEVDI